MGFVGRLEWMNIFTKKQCRRMFWRMRAAMKKAVKKKKNSVLVAGYGKKQFKFQYDPSSYALNFDDGVYHHHHHHHHQDYHHHDHVVEEKREKVEREDDDDHQIISAKAPTTEQQEQESHCSSSSSSTTWVYVIWVGSF